MLESSRLLSSGVRLMLTVKGQGTTKYEKVMPLSPRTSFTSIRLFIYEKVTPVENSHVIMRTY